MARIQVSVDYSRGTVKLRSTCSFNSGFKVSLHYVDGRQMLPNGSEKSCIAHTVDAAGLGITPTFELTPELSRLFALNQHILNSRTPLIDQYLRAHREHFAREAEAKRCALSYGFLIDFYGSDVSTPEELEASLRDEDSPKVQKIVGRHFGSLRYMHRRATGVQATKLSQWWYIFWDDLWRRNFQTVPCLQRHASDFGPQYRTSICYRPMSRAKLQEFLADRGLWRPRSKRGYFNHGVLK